MSFAVTPPGSFTAGAEGPACDAEGNLYAVNLARQGTIGQVRPDGTYGVFAEIPDGGVGNGICVEPGGRDLLIADYVSHTVWRLALADGAFSIVARDDRLDQPNDLAVTDAGQIYVSDPCWAASTGRLFRVYDGRFDLVAAGLGTVNGIETSPDDRTLYVTETHQRAIWAFPIEADGRLGKRRLMVTFPDHSLDGVRCDVDGLLYAVRYGKGTVVVVTPDGDVVREIPVRGSDCTNVAFGGPDGQTLYVTLADVGAVDAIRTTRPGRSWDRLQHAIERQT